VTRPTRSSNGNGRSSEAFRRLKSGALAHEFTTEERRRGAQRTNEIKRERAAKRRQAEEEAAEYGEGADKLLLLEAVERLQQELHCSDCRVALAAAELLLKYLLGPPGRTEEPGLLAPALAFAERMEQGGAHALFTALSPKPSAPAVEDVEDVGEERVTRLEAALGTSTGLSTPVRRADCAPDRAAASPRSAGPSSTSSAPATAASRPAWASPSCHCRDRT
jgi:hypothetical protein